MSKLNIQFNYKLFNKEFDKNKFFMWLCIIVYWQI